MKNRLITVPNLLSGLRIVLVPVLLALAWQQMQIAFLAVLAVSLLSDALDGYFARLLHQESDLGAKLDSWGDLLTYGAMIAGLYLAWPQVFDRERWFLALGVGFYLLPTSLSVLKFGELPSYHTWSAKLAALLLAPAYYLLTLLDMSLPFRAVIVLHVWVALEGVLIVLMLRRNQYNVPTFIHARNLSRRARASLQQQSEKLRVQRDKMRQRRAQRQDKRRGR